MGQRPVVAIDDMTQAEYEPRRPGCEKGVLHVEGPVPALNRTLPYVATLWGMFSVAYSLRFIHGAFFGPRPEDLPREPREPPRWMRFPIELLVVACLTVGVLPAITIGPFLDIAVRSMLGDQAPAYSLAVWHGFNTPFLMSLVALVGGVILYALLRRHFITGIEGAPLLRPLDGRGAFERVLFTLGRSWPRARSSAKDPFTATSSS